MLPAKAQQRAIPQSLFLGLKLTATKCRFSYQRVTRVETETLDLSAVHSIHLGSKYDRITARSQQAVIQRTVQQSSPIYVLVTQRLLLTFSAARRNCARLLNSLQNINRLQGLKLHLATPYQVRFALFIRYTSSRPVYTDINSCYTFQSIFKYKVSVV
jgi:hypothetical protein